jgi:hypothetical protein
MLCIIVKVFIPALFMYLCLFQSAAEIAAVCPKPGGLCDGYRYNMECLGALPYQICPKENKLCDTECYDPSTESCEN